MIAEYAWEKEYERTWEQVQEDESGRLTTSASAGRLAAGVVGRASGLGADSATTIAPTIRRGLMRFVVLILDTSVCMNMTDMTPTRRAVACEVCRGKCADCARVLTRRRGRRRFASSAVTFSIRIQCRVWGLWQRGTAGLQWLWP